MSECETLLTNELIRLLRETYEKEIQRLHSRIQDLEQSGNTRPISTELLSGFGRACQSDKLTAIRFWREINSTTLADSKQAIDAFWIHSEAK